MREAPTSNTPVATTEPDNRWRVAVGAECSNPRRTLDVRLELDVDELTRRQAAWLARSSSTMRQQVLASHRPPCPVGQPSTIIASATARHGAPSYAARRSGSGQTPGDSDRVQRRAGSGTVRKRDACESCHGSDQEAAVLQSLESDHLAADIDALSRPQPVRGDNPHEHFAVLSS